MSINRIISEEVHNFVFEGKTWYHGTPDATELNRTGFQPKTDTTDHIPDYQQWNQVQADMQDARASGDDDRYFELLDLAGTLRKPLTYKKPIFFTDKPNVASTYADSRRAFNYQTAEPRLLKVEIQDDGNVLRIPAQGQRFRMINADIVKKAFVDAGIPEEEIDRYYQMFPMWVRNNTISAETIGIIAQQLGFDIVDVIGVLDSYEGGSTPSTVRMVFDPQRIRIIN